MKVGKPATDYKAAVNIRGGFYVRQTRWGTVVQAWPRKRGKPATPYAAYVQAEFAYAGHWACDPERIAYQTAIFLAKGTLMMPRDYLVSAMYGSATEFIHPDGTTMERIRDVAPNPQLMLDMVTDIDGSMLYRAPVGWIGIPPGNTGQVLTMIGGAPAWANAQGGGGAGGAFIAFASNSVDTNGRASMGTILRPTHDLELIDFSIALDQKTGGIYTIGLAPFDETTKKMTAPPLKYGPYNSIGAVVAAPIVGVFNDNPVLVAGTSYLLYITRTDGSGTTGVNCRYSTQFPVGPGIAYSTVSNVAVWCTVADPDDTVTWSLTSDWYSTSFTAALA